MRGSVRGGSVGYEARPGAGGVVQRIQASNKRSPTEEWYGRVMVVGRGCSKCQSKPEV